VVAASRGNDAHKDLDPVPVKAEDQQAMVALHLFAKANCARVRLGSTRSEDICGSFGS